MFRVHLVYNDEEAKYIREQKNLSGLSWEHYILDLVMRDEVRKVDE